MLSFTRDDLISIWDKSRNPQELSNHLRVVALDLIQTAGSGHIGSSFSVMDVALAVHLFEQGDVFPSRPNENYRLFSSKGHDAPAIYSINYLLDLIPHSSMQLRRLGFLPGHPEIGSGGTVTNTGSLGMGISKAKGLAAADYRRGQTTSNYVILGDGELQEGQIWESLADASKVQGKVIAIVDGNGIQSDTWVEGTRSLGDVRSRVEATGWLFLEMDGHSFDEMQSTLEQAKSSEKPVFIWANTVKGFGSTSISNFPGDGLFYHYHSGALSPELAEIVRADLLGGSSTKHSVLAVDYSQSPKMKQPVMVNYWAEILETQMLSDSRIIAMDGDLALDTGTYRVAATIPDRYMQMGIAEQDMVSTAGGLALGGFLPIVHGFSTFLTMRPYEQIVNNASEGSAIVYVGFLAGIVPSAAGFSHQAVNDLAIMCAVPNMLVFEPATEQELSAAFQACLSHAGPSYLRLNSVPLPKQQGQFLELGGSPATAFTLGDDYQILCSGAFSLNNALAAQQILSSMGILGSVVSISAKSPRPFNLDAIELVTTSGPVLLIENAIWHYGVLSEIESVLHGAGRGSLRLAIPGFPQNGQPDEVARYHGFDPQSIAELISTSIGK